MSDAGEIRGVGERVVAASNEAMAVVDDKRYVAVNQAYADLHGLADPDELTGEPWASQFTEKSRDRIENEIVPTAREEGLWRGEVTGLRRDETTVPQELSVAPLDGSRLLSIARRTDGAEQSDTDVGRHTRLVEQAFDAVDDIVYVLDEDGDIDLWNAKLRETTGYTDAELAEMESKELIPPDQHDAVPGLTEAVDEIGDQHVELDIVTKDGERIPHAFLGTTFEDPETGGVYRCGIARDITDRKERERKLRAAREFNEELVENAPFGMFRLDEELRITYENKRAEEIIGLPEDQEESAAIGVDIRELPPIIETGKADLFSRLKDGEVIEFEFPFESIYGKEAYFTGRAVPLYRGGEFDGAILMATDISERRQHERDLERQRDELATLDRINELLFELTRDLFESPTRTEIQQTVCDRLITSELYRFAWVGKPEIGGDRIVPCASAGIDDGYVESITVTTTETERGDGPAGLAFRTGELQVSQDIRTDPRFEPWRDAALDRGIQSAAAVPLVHGATVYGVLAVYASRPMAFSHREQAGFRTLGKAVGFAINAIENRRLLFADAVVELEFEVTDSDLVFVRLSENLECELTITGFVVTDGGEWSVYFTVDGAPPAAVRDVATDDPIVDRIRVIAEEADAGLFEVVVDGAGLTTVAEHGAILTAGSVDNGTGRFCFEVPQSTDIRRVADRLQEMYPDLTLVAQREFDRPVRNAVELRQSLHDRLTDRQQEALERAYHSGYFHWPRQSAAADVADSMGIAETTFHYHLRHALDTLLAELVSLEER